MSVSCAEVIVGAEKHLIVGISLKYDDENYSKAYGENVLCFTELTKDKVLFPNITQVILDLIMFVSHMVLMNFFKKLSLHHI